MIGFLLLLASTPLLVFAAEEPKQEGLFDQLVKPIGSFTQFPNQLQNAAQQLLPPIVPILSTAGQVLNTGANRPGRAIGYREDVQTDAIIIPLPHKYPYFLSQQIPYSSYNPLGYAVVPLPFAPKDPSEPSEYTHGTGSRYVYTLPKIYHTYVPSTFAEQSQTQKQEKTQTAGAKPAESSPQFRSDLDVTGKPVPETQQVETVGQVGQGLAEKKVNKVEGVVPQGETVFETPKPVKVTVAGSEKL